MDLMGTVRHRYGRTDVIGLRITLVHRDWSAVARPEPKKQKWSGLLDFFRPHISSIAKKTHGEITDRLNQWTRKREKLLPAEIGKEVARQTSIWKELTARSEKAQRENSKASGKRIELVLAQTNAQLGALRRDTGQMMRREEEKKRELQAKAREELPVSAKDARRMIEGRLEALDVTLQEKIERNARKNVCDTVRRIRDEEEYERIRNAGRR